MPPRVDNRFETVKKPIEPAGYRRPGPRVFLFLELQQTAWIGKKGFSEPLKNTERKPPPFGELFYVRSMVLNTLGN